MSKEKFNLREYINSEEFEVDFKELLDFEKVGSTEKVIIECKTAILNYDSLDILDAIFENKGLNINLAKLSEQKEEELRKGVQHRINHIFAKEEADLNIHSSYNEYIELFKKSGFDLYKINEDLSIFIDHKNNLLISLQGNENDFNCTLVANGKLRKHIKEEHKLEEVIGIKIEGTEIDYISVNLKELPLFKIQKVIEMYKATDLYYAEKFDLGINENINELFVLNNEKLVNFFNSNYNLHQTEKFKKHIDFMNSLSLEEKEDILYRYYIFNNPSQDRLLFNDKLIQKIIENNIDINLFKVTLNDLKENENTIIHSLDSYKKAIFSFGEIEIKELKERTIDEKYYKLSEEEKNDIDSFMKKNEKIINVTRKIVH